LLIFSKSIKLRLPGKMSLEFKTLGRFSTVVLLTLGLLLAVMVLTSESHVVAVRRSIRQSPGSAEEECRTNGICGWVLYNRTTRVNTRNIPATCRCNKKDLCVKAEDDLDIPAYTYRCSPNRRLRTTVRPGPTAGNTP